MKLYSTVRKEASAEQVIERSRFIAYVSPAETKEEADAFIASVRKKHRDATHNVPVMVLGDRTTESLRELQVHRSCRCW